MDKDFDDFQPAGHIILLFMSTLRHEVKEQVNQNPNQYWNDNNTGTKWIYGTLKRKLVGHAHYNSSRNRFLIINEFDK